MPNSPFKWLLPGMNIKRWVFSVLLGIIVVGLGATFVTKDDWFVKAIGILWIACGTLFTVYGVGKLIVSLLALFLPKGERDLVSILYQKRFLERGPKIVTIGGGTGISHLIFGLKEYTANITAIVTVADSGGSSGRLREEFNIVAPGDIRNCLVALADAPEIMGKLFQYRFSKDSQLQGHNFGNLFLTAMVQLKDGDFEKAVKETSKVLAIRGKVVPSTIENVHLVADYEDGTRTQGEAKIPNPDSPVKRVYLTPDSASPTQDALDAIAEADVIILGPGSLFTSVIPNLCIKGMSEAIAKAQGFKIYICNVMTQHGETDGFTASRHLQAIINHSNKGIVGACLVNNVEPPAHALGRYRDEKSFPVKADIELIRQMGYRVVATDLLGITDYVRHDSKKLLKALISLIESNRIIKR